MVPGLSALLVLLCLALTGASAFYAKFGTYPNPAIVLDFMAAPAAFIAYTRSGASVSDVVVFVGIALTVTVAGVAVTRRVWREPPEVHRAAWNVDRGCPTRALSRDARSGPGRPRSRHKSHPARK